MNRSIAFLSVAIVIAAVVFAASTRYEFIQLADNSALETSFRESLATFLEPGGEITADDYRALSVAADAPPRVLVLDHWTGETHVSGERRK